MSDVDAVVLVGGLGTRLRPLTLSAPKPMLPTAGVPFLTHLLSRIRDAGVTHVVLGTSYRAEVFAEHFGDGAALGLELEYVVETEPLGTGGGIRNVADRLRGDTVMVFNGDVLSGLDLRELLGHHERTAADLTLYLTPVEDPRAFGCVPTDADGRVTAFLEKDPNPVTDQINAGTYVFRRELVDSIPAGRPVSVERETFPGLIEAGALVMGYLETAYWLDVGTPQAFVRGSCDLVLGRLPRPAVPGEPGPALTLADATVAGDADVSGGTVVGVGASVGAGATVFGSVLFDGAAVGEGAEVHDSILGRGAIVAPGAVLHDAVIGDEAYIGSGNELARGIRVWPGTRLEPTSVRFSSDA